MPLYKYKCSKCKCIFEELQDIGDIFVFTCPKCGDKTDRLFPLNFCDKKYGSGKEYFEKEIKLEAEKIARKIKEGDEEAASDVLGEDFWRD